MARKFYIQDNATVPSIVFENSKPEGYTLVASNHPLMRLLIKKKQDEHRKAGIKYFRDTSVNMISSGLPIDAIVHIEEKLNPVELRLTNGHWTIAIVILRDQVTPDGILTQGFYQLLLDDFTDYILNNY
jgi:hypothetical protein